MGTHQTKTNLIMYNIYIDENVWYQHKDVSWAKAVQVNTPLFGEKFVANYIPVTLR